MKFHDNSFNSWIDKRDYSTKMSYFPDSYSHSKKKMKFKLDLSNHATKSDLKNATGVNSSKLVDELDIDKLKTVPVDAIVNVVGISGFLLKTQFNSNKSGLEKKNNDTGGGRGGLILVDLLKKKQIIMQRY